MLRTSEDNTKILKANTILTGNLNVIKFPEVTDIFVICQIEICKGACDSKCHPPFKIDPLTTTAQSPSSELKLTTLAPTTMRPTTKHQSTTHRASTKHHSRHTTQKPTTKHHSGGLSEIEKEVDPVITTTAAAAATTGPTGSPTTESTTLSDEIEESSNMEENNLEENNTVENSTAEEESSTMLSDPTDPSIEADYSQTGRRFWREQVSFSDG